MRRSDTLDSSLYYDGRRPDLKRFIPKRYQRVLEIGCATGGFRENFGDCEYWGVECVEEIAEQARTRLDKVLTGTFDEVFEQLPDQYFDTVICNDVIEHMVDHEAFLKKIKRKISRGGRLMGSIPNVRYVHNLLELIYQKDWAYREEGILDHTHLRFFTLKSLKRSLQSNDYEIETLEGINDCFPKRWYRIPLSLLFHVSRFGRDSRYLQFYFSAIPNG